VAYENSGNLMIEDADGVIAIPLELLDALLPRVLEHEQCEAAIREANPSGRSDPERFNGVLHAHGSAVPIKETIL
jgi:regulator of RNase E activity RraA